MIRDFTARKSSCKTMLQVIQTMIIGGAQRTASRLMRLPGFDVELITFDQLHTVSEFAHYDVLFTHVWCEDEYGKSLDLHWPPYIPGTYGTHIAMNHSYRGAMTAGYDHYIVYSDFAKRNSIFDGPVSVIPGSIRYGAFSSFAMRAPRSESEVVVGRLSTMHSGKINEAILRPWRQLTCGEFLIGGDGVMRAHLLEQFADDARFHFAGTVPAHDVPRFLSQIDIFLYDTAEHVESFCYVVAEAMAAGCVVVAGAKGAIPELIHHGSTGFLFETPEQAIEICADLAKHQHLRTRIAEQGRAHVRENYSIERFHDAILAAVNSSGPSHRPVQIKSD